VVQAEAERHQLASGEALVLDPDVPHSVEAVNESDMLLTLCKG
jgi:quercetin dioxygenase-like cupin family protein